VAAKDERLRQMEVEISKTTAAVGQPLFWSAADHEIALMRETA
jgi:hypothetical protein